MEVPAVALRVAAGFADSRSCSFDGVWIRPGDEEGQVMVSAASTARAIELRCEGACQRPVGLPVLALQTAVKRHRDAHHVVLIAGDAGVSLRSFSSDTTVVVGMPEAAGSPRSLPGALAGEFTVDPLAFDVKLLRQTLEIFDRVGTVHIVPFSIGWRITANCDEYSATAVVAGVAV